MNSFNLLILNYAFTWLLLSFNTTYGIVFSILIWSVLILTKLFELLIRKFIIGFILGILGVAFPFLIPFLAIIPLLMLLAAFLKAKENWILLLIGFVLYFILYKYPSGLYTLYLGYLNVFFAKLFSFITGAAVVIASTLTLQSLGFQKKTIDNVMLKLPVFVIALVFAMVNQDLDSDTDS